MLTVLFMTSFVWLNKYPERVSILFEKVLDGYRPNYDYKDQLKILIRILSKKGRLKEALVFADRIRYLPGVEQLYKQLT